MFVHYDPTTLKVSQSSTAARPFRREGSEVALVQGLPQNLGGGFSVVPESLRPAVVDPVCDAVFDPNGADHRTIERDGTLYHFCSDHCAVKFFLAADKCLEERAARVANGAAQDGPWQCCEVVALPAPPPAIAEIKIARNSELAATDAYLVTDRPMPDEVRAAWRTYRQALRDLGALSTAEEMIAAWPIRPDGRDVIADMRARV
jgi:YHS domain-containing protein